MSPASNFDLYLKRKIYRIRFFSLLYLETNFSFKSLSSDPNKLTMFCRFFIGLQHFPIKFQLLKWLCIESKRLV